VKFYKSKYKTLLLMVFVLLSSDLMAGDLAKRAVELCEKISNQQKAAAKAAGINLNDLCEEANGELEGDDERERSNILPGRSDGRLARKSSKRDTVEDEDLTRRSNSQDQRVKKSYRDDKNIRDRMEEKDGSLELFQEDSRDQLQNDYPYMLEEQVDVNDIPVKDRELLPFGYDVFAGEPRTFSPANDVPVSGDYVLGPGDQLDIQLYGAVSTKVSLVIKRDGSIEFPEIGPVYVANLNYSEVKTILEQKVKEHFIGVNISITLGELRSIRVYVLGESRYPGAYTLSSLSTVTHALYFSGGVKELGSMRNIQLKREGKIIATLDLYDLMMKGDNKRDKVLRAGDIIHIPPVGKTVSIAGYVKRPAIYEFKADHQHISDLMNLAGGFLSNAYKSNVKLLRLDNKGRTTVKNIDMTRPNNMPHIHILDGDRLNVTSTNDEEKANIVSVEGHVYRPGDFEWRSDLRVNDVLSFQHLKDAPDLDVAYIIREDLKTRRVNILSFNVSEALKGGARASNIRLKEKDRVLILGRNEERNEVLEPIIESLRKQASADNPAKIASVVGQVKFPGEYPLTYNMTLKKLITAAGGYSEIAYQNELDITRRIKSINGYTPQTETVSKYELGQYKVQSNDVARVRVSKDFDDFVNVEVSGEVVFPDEYRLKRGATLKQLIERVGGVTNFGQLSAAVFTRETLKETELDQILELRNQLSSQIASSAMQMENLGTKVNFKERQQLLDVLAETEVQGRLVVNLPGILSGLEDDILLKDGDKLHVPDIKQEVTVIGEVQRPTSHSHRDDWSVSDYVKGSGGATDQANTKQIYIVKANGSVETTNRSVLMFMSSSQRRLAPGDVIVVPPSSQKYVNIGLWTKISQVIYQLALGAAALKSL
jgi:polysaccharide biosynthesis/export protein